MYDGEHMLISTRQEAEMRNFRGAMVQATGQTAAVATVEATDGLRLQEDTVRFISGSLGLSTVSICHKHLGWGFGPSLALGTVTTVATAAALMVATDRD
jgi:hypothetical protein